MLSLSMDRVACKGYRRRASTNRTNNGRGEGPPLSRQRVITFNTKFVSVSKSHVASGWLSPPGCFLSSRRSRQNSRASKESMQELIVWVWGSVTHGNAVEQYTWALSVLIRTLLPEGMASGHAKMEASCLVLHVLVACTLAARRFVAASLRDGRAVLPGCSVLGGLSIWGCSTTEEALANRSQSKPVQFPGALGLDIPFFLSLHSSGTRRTCVLWVSRAHLFVCSLWAGVLRERLKSFELSVDPDAEVASVGDCFISAWSMQTGFRIS